MAQNRINKLELTWIGKDLECRRSEKRLNLYHAHDEVDERKETLLSRVEAMLAQHVAQQPLITFHWTVI